jgi:hypothetical protein
MFVKRLPESLIPIVKRMRKKTFALQFTFFNFNDGKMVRCAPATAIGSWYRAVGSQSKDQRAQWLPRVVMRDHARRPSPAALDGAARLVVESLLGVQLGKGASARTPIPTRSNTSRPDDRRRRRRHVHGDHRAGNDAGGTGARRCATRRVDLTIFVTRQRWSSARETPRHAPLGAPRPWGFVAWRAG